MAAFLALVLALTAASASAQVEQRVALVMGNAAYPDQPLKNPVNDARLMAGKLRELGFDVILRENATRDSMGAAVRDFTRKLQPGVVALVYYAGHGIQSRGRNYLIPVDASLGAESDLRFQAVDIGALTEELEQGQARVSLVILDACRNNPFEKKLRGAARGLTAIDAARGGLIAYATAPGSVAADGDGENGPYTEELVKAMSVPNLKVEEVFKRVIVGVEQRTNGQQTPWISSSLRGDFVFNITVNAQPGATVNVAPAPASPAAASQAESELVFWRSAQQSNRVEEYDAYLAQFPQGLFANLAKLRIAELQKPAPPAPTPKIAAAPAPAARPSPPPLAPTTDPQPPASPPSSPQVGFIPPQPIEGVYKVSGTAGSATYGGTARISRIGTQYEVIWQVGNTYRGVGGFQGDKLVIDWGQRYPVIYTIAPDGRLMGTWDDGAGTEVLERY
ncbi:MAG: caspase family protein [Alphaproteobacteria bacterium]|nr:caspase family protein [Alphaproteobacteria bacterium]